MKTEEEAGSDRGRGGIDRPVFTEEGVRNRRMMILCEGKKRPEVVGECKHTDRQRRFALSRPWRGLDSCCL